MTIKLYEEIIDEKRWHLNLVHQLKPFSDEPEDSLAYDVELREDETFVGALCDFPVSTQSYHHPKLSWAPFVWAEAANKSKRPIPSRLRRLNELANTSPFGAVKEVFSRQDIKEQFESFYHFEQAIADTRGAGAYLYHPVVSGILLIFVKSGSLTTLFTAEEWVMLIELYM